jgi:hypothetical protein
MTAIGAKRTLANGCFRPKADIDRYGAKRRSARCLMGRKGDTICPDFAKSAGNLIALSANSIVMSDSSEFGRIHADLFK